MHANQVNRSTIAKQDKNTKIYKKSFLANLSKHGSV